MKAMAMKLFRIIVKFKRRNSISIYSNVELNKRRIPTLLKVVLLIQTKYHVTKRCIHKTYSSSDK